MFSLGEKSGIKLLFTRARSSGVGSASPPTHPMKKLNPDQTSFKMISPTVIGSCKPSKISKFYFVFCFVLSERKLLEANAKAHRPHRQEEFSRTRT